MKSYFEETIRIVSDSIRSIDLKAFEELVSACERTLHGGGKIIASGLGKNVPVCEKFVGAMVSLGLDANFMHTNSAVHGDLGMVHDKDLVIVLSKSGTTVETVYLVEQLVKRGCEIWLLTFSRDCALAQELHHSIVLTLEHEGDPWNIVPNHSTTLNLIVLQALAMTLAERMGIRLEDFKPNHPGGAIGDQLRGKCSKKFLTDKGIILPLSELPHTWILDMDGTLVKHNGYKTDGTDSFLEGAKEFLLGIDEKDMIILLTSRKEDAREETEAFLRKEGIRYNTILFNVPYGERVLLNDDKPSGLKTAIAIRKKRDAALRIEVLTDEVHTLRKTE